MSQDKQQSIAYRMYSRRMDEVMGRVPTAPKGLHLSKFVVKPQENSAQKKRKPRATARELYERRVASQRQSVRTNLRGQQIPNVRPQRMPDIAQSTLDLLKTVSKDKVIGNGNQSSPPPQSPSRIVTTENFGELIERPIRSI